MCESVCPRTYHHIARSAHDECLIMNFACMSFAYAGWSDTL